MKITITLFTAIISSFIFANTPVMNLGEFQQSVAAVSGSAKPVYYDIDRDGEKDLITGCADGRIYIYKNNGTTENPIFDIYTLATLEGGTEIDLIYSSLPEITDWNGDNLPDLLIGNYKSTYIYTNATAAAGVMPVFAEAGAITSLGGTTNIVYGNGELSITAVSYDGTSSNDLLIGEKDFPNGIIYYKNIGTYSSPVLTNMGHVKDVNGIDLSFGYGPSPIYFDWDDDGTNELIVGEMSWIYVYYTTNYPPAWIEKARFDSSPAMTYYKLNSCGDINSDGKNDLLAGDFTGGLYWLTNAGVAESSFSTYVSVSAAQTNVIYSSNGCAVNIWDYNGDGLWDISMRRAYSGGDRIYPNVGNTNSPDFSWFVPEGYSNGSYDRFYTFNSNQFRYTFRFDNILIYTNVGSYSSPLFSTWQYLMEGTNEISYAYGHSGYDVADLNGDGKLDLWYIFYGTNYWFENTNDNFTPIYKKREIALDNNSSQLIFQTSAKYMPTIYDWNDDGKPDLLVADNQRKIRYYQNISNFPPTFVDYGVLEVIGEGELDFGAGPQNFGIKDIDNNGLANLFIGFGDKTIREFEAVPEPALFINLYLLFMILAPRMLGNHFNKRK